MEILYRKNSFWDVIEVEVCDRFKEKLVQSLLDYAREHLIEESKIDIVDIKYNNNTAYIHFAIINI